MPRRISLTAREAIKKSSSACSAIQAKRDFEGSDLTTLLMMSVSRR